MTGGLYREPFEVLADAPLGRTGRQQIGDHRDSCRAGTNHALSLAERDTANRNQRQSGRAGLAGRSSNARNPDGTIAGVFRRRIEYRTYRQVIESDAFTPGIFDPGGELFRRMRREPDDHLWPDQSPGGARL